MTLTVDPDLFSSFMEKISDFGSTSDGGLNREAGTTDHGLARDWFFGQLRDRGYQIRIDEIGNVFAVLEANAREDTPVIMVGSHLDSQPFGGRFDGAYGVIAAFAAVEALRAEAEASGAPPSCSFVIVDWMNEEGARFQPSLLGSSVYCGELGLNYALTRCDGAGLTVGDELERTGYRGKDAAPRADIYIELHVEGNDELEKTNLQIGPFARYWGALKIRAAMHGETAHTGPTLMRDRRDATLAAAHAIVGTREISDRRDGALYSSCGRLVIQPNSPNMVADLATMFLELRSPDPDDLHAAEVELMEVLRESAAKVGVTHEVISIDRREAGAFDPRLVALCERQAEALGLGTMQLETIGGHDAVPVSRKMPGIVIAIPSVGGVIHHPTEYSKPEDLMNGANVLAGMIHAIAQAGGDLDRTLGDNA
ncbi:Zn-dependent hydrolase [Tateyamaria pelophila]|uniref:Zn-dependent hydrolase n=1 Tax=Tateyamaria pelophila TaxID=328415 RepID=UPI001CBB3CFF|nr:Zn-dependent hydrolase [Tateyamaria pelophila]